MTDDEFQRRSDAIAATLRPAVLGHMPAEGADHADAIHQVCAVIGVLAGLQLELAHVIKRPDITARDALVGLIDSMYRGNTLMLEQHFNGRPQ